MLPPDLTPAEMAQVRRLLEPGRWTPPGPHVIDPDTQEAGVGATERAGEPDDGGGQPHETWRKVDALEKALEVGKVNTKLLSCEDLVSLADGAGIWMGHDFDLTPERLAAIRAICADQVADKLTAEIERVRTAHGKVS